MDLLVTSLGLAIVGVSLATLVFVVDKYTIEEYSD